MDTDDDVSRLLAAAGASEHLAPDDLAALFAAAYPQLRALAASGRARWHGDHTLSATVLVHEAYLKVAAAAHPRFESRGHFLACAARAMRQVLIDYAKRQRAQRRGGGAGRVPLTDVDVAAEDRDPAELLALDAALTKLATLEDRQARVVECRFFAGLDVDDTAEALGVSRATVVRDWTTARAWLVRELGGAPAPPVSGGA